MNRYHKDETQRRNLSHIYIYFMQPVNAPNQPKSIILLNDLKSLTAFHSFGRTLVTLDASFRWKLRKFIIFSLVASYFFTSRRSPPIGRLRWHMYVRLQWKWETSLFSHFGHFYFVGVWVFSKTPFSPKRMNNWEWIANEKEDNECKIKSKTFDEKLLRASSYYLA